MEFSVLMPVYHGDSPNTFKAAVLSVMNNTVKPSEFILVVDGPVPAPIEAAINHFENLYGSILRVHWLPKNVGIVQALNFGLQKCRHELIARCDADDVNRKDRFSVQLSTFAKHDISLCGGAIIENYGEYSLLKKMPVDQKNIKNYVRFRNPFNHMTVMFKKSSILNCGGYPNVKFREDYALWATVISKGYKVMNLPDPLVDVTADLSMFRRRSGVSQFFYELKLQKLLLHLDLISVRDFLRNLIVRGGSHCLPVRVKRTIYSKFLRS